LNHLRLYGHNLCSFVTRARYALALNKVPFQEAMVCLNNKAEWHLNFNGGFVPILETPAGDLIKESSVIMMYAHEAGTGSTIPKDPIQAAKMRLEMEAFNGKTSSFVAMLYSGGQDAKTIDEKTDAFAKDLPYWEDMCRRSEGKFLFRTDEPTLLDVHVAPYFEKLAYFDGSVNQNCFDRLDVHNNGKHILEYVKRWQAHELIHPYRQRRAA